MNIPKAIGWDYISNNLGKLNIIGINHTSFGFPPATNSENSSNIENFYYQMGKIFEFDKNLTKNKTTEWFIYPNGQIPGYEHLLMPKNTVDKPFYHIEIDVKDSDTRIKEIFPEAWEEQPHMFWLTASEDFLGILWAVILTNKRSLSTS